jgi:triosephosphate isomerase
MTKKLVVGNWKMNPTSIDEAKHISGKTRLVAAGLINTNVVACPPAVFISACIPRNKAANFSIGAQSVFFEEEGAYTGEVSANMLKSVGASHVIAGHSEERARGDTDEIVSKRIKVILEAGLIPIVCVGEKSRDNESGSHFDFLKEQIKNTFANVPKKYASEIILAYEPVWAIGAKEAMAPEQIYEMNLFVKKTFADLFGSDLAIKATVLYGGSVTFRNAGDIIKTGQVDGLLVGRESVNVAGFVELLKEVDKAV